MDSKAKKAWFVFILIILVVIISLFMVKNIPTVNPKNVANLSNKPFNLSNLSEPKIIAEYNYDSKIEDTAFYDNGTPKVVATEKEVLFYDPNGKIVRKRTLAINEQVQISKNGDYIAYVHGSGLMGTRDKMNYEDAKGNILFEKWLEAQWPEPSPLGDYLVLTPIGYHDLIEFVGKDGGEIAKYHMGVGGGKGEVKYSTNGEKCFVASAAAIQPLTAIKIFENKGGKIIFENKLAIQEEKLDVSEDGEYWAISGFFTIDPWTAGFVYYRNDKLLFRKENGAMKIFIAKKGGVVVSTEFYPKNMKNMLFIAHSKNGNELNRKTVDEFGFSRPGAEITGGVSDVFDNKILFHIDASTHYSTNPLEKFRVKWLASLVGIFYLDEGKWLRLKDRDIYDYNYYFKDTMVSIQNEEKGKIHLTRVGN